MRRDRTRSLVLAAGTIAIGLAVHRHGQALAPDVRDMLGDALWAAMAFWLVSALAPTARRAWRAIASLAICVVVELSQLWHLPVLDGWRRTTVGQLTLGSGFDPRDFAAYAAGVIAGVLVERIFLRSSR